MSMSAPLCVAAGVRRVGRPLTRSTPGKWASAPGKWASPQDEFWWATSTLRSSISKDSRKDHAANVFHACNRHDMACDKQTVNCRASVQHRPDVLPLFSVGAVRSVAGLRACKTSPALVIGQIRLYQNIWGSNAGKTVAERDKSKQDASVQTDNWNAVGLETRPKAQDDLEADGGGWRLDWEEDGRWVEWRLDAESQSQEDRFRVTMEWTRYRNARGRDHTNLWEEESERSSGFKRGTARWWREQYYEYEYAGANGISSMSAVKQACETLGISDAGDAGAVRATYLRLVNKWHPDRFHHHTAEEQAAANSTFRRVQEAYELLKERESALV